MMIVDRTIPDLSNKSLHEIQMLDGVNKTWREEGSDTYELGTEGEGIAREVSGKCFTSLNFVRFRSQYVGQ